MKVKEEELVKDLRRVFDIIKSPPSKSEYSKYGKFCSVIYLRIKSWNQWMLDVFGEDCGRPSHQPTAKAVGLPEEGYPSSNDRLDDS